MYKKQRSKSGLKQLAAEAKARLSKGYWEEIRADREEALREATILGKDPQNVMQYYLERCSHEIAAMNNPIDRREEDLYRKVKNALDRDGEIANPVALLSDPKLTEAMTDSERQRYVFSLTNKYSELKKRYYREKMLTDGITAINESKFL